MFKPMQAFPKAPQSSLISAILTSFFSLLLLILPLQSAQATAVFDLPIISAGSDTWVVDEANVISRLNETNLTSSSQELASTTGFEVRYVTLRHLDFGQTIENFADQLFSAWFNDPEAQANQVLVVLDTVTNNAAVRTGATAQAQLSPEIANSVAQATMMAPLIDGDKYNQAFEDAKNRLVAVLSGQPDPGAPNLVAAIDVDRNFATAEETEANRSNTTTLVIVLLVLATVIPMVTYYVLYQ